VFKFSKKKTLAVVAGGALILGAIGIAYAYWTAGGTGTGSGETGTSVAITAVQTSDITNIRPGGEPQTLSGNFTNTNDEPVFVTSVTVTVDSVTQTPEGIIAGSCEVDDYVIVDGVMPVNAEVPVGTAQGAWTGATIAFVNEPAEDQGGCQGATVNLAYVIA
jgi:hypothetical protein